MCPPVGNNTELEDDAPAPQSASGSGAIPSASQPPSGNAAGGLGSFTPSSPGGGSSPRGVAAQLDPGTGSTSLPAPTPSRSGVPIGSPAPPRSIALDVAPSSTSREGPVTRLQRGVSKPKTYTDGTVLWGMSASTIPEDLQMLSRLSVTKTGL
jgi:hypothetical protein